ncbi:hypothetical protein SAMN04487909_15626 [Aneurinibacillus migulanus]|uniref:Uncharacterized protein n=3 Tax=Aneurinibacillus migulanus TaxID=47500 RepID=A0A1G9C150_ANEMI|nr:hypothetical protein SAMN04487909_15626 [Aneurinibacillus migulanus]
MLCCPFAKQITQPIILYCVTPIDYPYIGRNKMHASACSLVFSSQGRDRPLGRGKKRPSTLPCGRRTDARLGHGVVTIGHKTGAATAIRDGVRNVIHTLFPDIMMGNVMTVTGGGVVLDKYRAVQPYPVMKTEGIHHYEITLYKLHLIF